MLSQAIIFIPGTKGTNLEDRNTFGHDILWRDFRFMTNPIENLQLSANAGSGYYDKKADSLIAPGALEYLAYNDFYENISHRFKGKKPLFLFNYDWRMSNKQTGEKLHAYIEDLKQKSIAAHAADNSIPIIQKVDIIIHSQGNHVLRHYINDNGFSSINKAIFVAPPFLGSLEMVKAMLCGQGFLWAKEKTRKIVRTFPGSFELLPTYECAAQFKNNDPVDFFNFNHWQKAKGIINNQAAFTKLLNEAKAANNAIRTGWLNNLTNAEKKRILVIVKSGYKTMQKVVVDKDNEGCENEVDFKRAVESKDGDKIVPHVSSTVYAGTLKTLQVNLAPWVDDRNHGFLLLSGRVQRLINRFLEGGSLAMPGRHIEEVTTPYKVICNE